MEEEDQKVPWETVEHPGLDIGEREEEDQKVPWEIDEERDRPTNYVLNSADRAFCATGETSNKTQKSRVRERIREDKLKELPTRFQDLVDDLALVKDSDETFLSEEEWDEIWSEMSEIKPRLDAHMGGTKRLSETAQSNESIQFGFALGVISRFFLKFGDISDMSWGYLLGLHMWPVELGEQEATHLKRTLDKLNDAHEDRSSRMEALQEGQLSQEKIRDNNKDYIINQLHDYGICLQSVPVPDEDLFHDLYSRPHRFSQDEIDKEIESNIECIKFLDSLRWDVENDSHYIKTKNLFGADPESIIEELWEDLDDQSGDSAIGKHVDDMFSLERKHMGKGLLNKMSIDTKNEMETIHPIVTTDSNGRWKLTKYGQLTAYTLFELDRWCLWIYRCSLFGCSIPEKPQKLIEEAIDELDYEHPDEI